LETFDNSVLVVGNGESRKNIDLTKFKGFIIGCNALHREIIPDYLVCCDRRMVDEALQNPNINECKIYVRDLWYHYFRKIKKNKNIICLPSLPYIDKNKFDQPDHWGSGSYAVLLAAQLNYQNVYLLGFDLYSLNSKVNNIYKNSENYSKDSSLPVDPSFWIIQLEKLFQIYKEKNFIIINNDYWKIPDTWKKENVQHKNIEHFLT
jgi:hypothetical protein